MKRLWCRLFGHCWNLISISGESYYHHDRWVYRFITGRDCRRCGEPGPETDIHFRPITDYDELEKFRGA